MTLEQALSQPVQPPEKFQVGDKVAHINLGDGHVTAREPERGIITVTYERKYTAPKTLKGKSIVHNYDAAWFIRNPKYLFHRTLPQAEGFSP